LWSIPYLNYSGVQGVPLGVPRLLAARAGGGGSKPELEIARKLARQRLDEVAALLRVGASQHSAQVRKDNRVLFCCTWCSVTRNCVG
jgi:hypothetical protein